MNFSEILKKIKRVKIAVVGDLMLDRYVLGEVERISQEAPVPVVRLKSEECRPGGAANAAANAASLGAKVFLFGVLGDDTAGKYLIDLLSREGVNNEGVISLKIPTIEKTRVIASGQQIVRLDTERTDGFPAKASGMILSAILGKMPKLDAIIISDYAKGVINTDLARLIIKAAKNRNIPVIAAPKPDNFLMMRGAEVIVPNKKEAEAAVGRKFQNETDLIRAGSVLAKRSRSAILITRGSEGMSLFENGSARHIKSAAKEVYDVTGAGDTVAAVLALGRACGLSLYKAALIANAAAGIAVGKRGTATVSPEELYNSLNGYES